MGTYGSVGDSGGQPPGSTWRANYLIPIGADIQAEDEVKFNAIDANLVLSKMESAGNDVNIVIFDACRDNPFARSFRSSSRGLAIVEAPSGSLVIYATAPGSVAADGTGRNGVFSGAFLRHVRTPGIDVEVMLRDVRRDVMAETGGRQTPWSSSSMTGSFCFVGNSVETTEKAEDERTPTFSVQKAYGSMEVVVETDGTFYLDGVRQGRISVGGTATIKDIETGSHSLEMRYDNGEKESKRVTVTKDRTVRAVFGYVERPRVPEGYVLVEAGTFRMGSTDGAGDEKPVHSVTVSRPFLMSKYEVTQRQWRKVMGTSPSRFKGDNLPVELISWYDAIEYCNALSRKEGLSPCYSESGESIRCDFSANGYRLPTEAEWEYAARGGNRSRGYTYSGSNNAGGVGWSVNNSGGKTHEVGKKSPNELGIYDMSGNVWEWCWDRYGQYGSSSQSDPSGPSRGFSRVRRGGSWGSFAGGLRSANRYGTPSVGSQGGSYRLGFRPVRTAE